MKGKELRKRLKDVNAGLGRNKKGHRDDDLLQFTTQRRSDRFLNFSCLQT
jgi:hypothetical protein